MRVQLYTESIIWMIHLFCVVAQYLSVIKACSAKIEISNFGKKKNHNSSFFLGFLAPYCDFSQINKNFLRLVIRCKHYLLLTEMLQTFWFWNLSLNFRSSIYLWNTFMTINSFWSNPQFSTSWKCQKANGFLTFSGDI